MQKVLLQSFNMSDNSPAKDENQLLILKEFSFDFAQSIMYGYFGVKPCNCNTAKKEIPARAGFRTMQTYFGFPENSEYGLTDCGKIEKGGAYKVDNFAVKSGKPTEKSAKELKKSVKNEANTTS